MRLDREKISRHDDVADDDDHQVGRKVVGAVMVEFFGARLTAVDHLQEPAEQFSFAAIRTPQRKAAPHGLGERDLFLRVLGCDDGIP